MKTRKAQGLYKLAALILCEIVEDGMVPEWEFQPWDKYWDAFWEGYWHEYWDAYWKGKEF